MAGMGFMIAAASRSRDDRDHEGNTGNYSRMDGDMEMRRRRDSRGRYMGDDDDLRMGNDHSTYMGMEAPEMRRRRDSRGRYMETDGGNRMAYDGNQGNENAYRPWPEPHIPPCLDRPGMEDGSRMRVRNVVNIRDYQDKRRIGFGANRMDDGEEDEDMRQYGRRYNPDRMTMGHSQHNILMMGHADSDDDHLTREEAEKWVKGMKSEDGKTGGRWPYQEIKQYAGNFGIQGEDKIIEFYAVMNALYTDYCKVAKKHGVDKVDFWADMAKAFISDKDAKPGKVKMYYECIAKHDEE
jgi:hypothetical protein